jgi:hypothetical protein
LYREFNQAVAVTNKDEACHASFAAKMISCQA